MQNQKNEVVTCKFCQENFPVNLMFSHSLDCNLRNHPEYQSIIQNQEPQKQQVEHVSSDNSKIKQVKNDSQIKQRQKVQDFESQKYSSQDLIQYQQKKSATQQELKQNNLSNQQTESILAQTTKKCEYCKEIFPQDQIDEHYQNCQICLMIEQMQIEEIKNEYYFQENNSQVQVQQAFSQQISNPNTNQRTFEQQFESFITNKTSPSETEVSEEQRLISKIRVQSLGRILFSNSDQLDQEFKQCSICYLNYQKNVELILLPCTHRFHHDCIYRWLLTQSTCPICKIDLEQSPSS